MRKDDFAQDASGGLEALGPGAAGRSRHGFARSGLNHRQVALDEVQLAPEVFPALRVAIDARSAESGLFVITGSSSPELLRSVSQSLAGRVGIIELAPFSWSEVTATSGMDSLLRRLLNRKARPADLVSGLKPRADVHLAHEFWFQGGFPEPWLNPGTKFHKH